MDDTVLYEQFVAARRTAVELTDLYRQTADDDPCRPLLWDGVVRETERARRLLESWLQLAPSAGESNDRSRHRAQECLR
jgi:hypothetical protein